MKYAIISDIHANPAALERVLADAERCGAEKVVCAGDVVGYGPDPAGAIRILRERGIPTVMGNHDAAVSGWRDTDGMIDTAREGTERHRRELGKGDLDWLRALPYVRRFCCRARELCQSALHGLHPRQVRGARFDDIPRREDAVRRTHPCSGGLHARILLRPILPRLPPRGGRTRLPHEGRMPVSRECRGGRLSACAAVFQLRPLRSGVRRGTVPRDRFRLQGLCGCDEGKVDSCSALGRRTDIFLRIP